MSENLQNGSPVISTATDKKLSIDFKVKVDLEPNNLVWVIGSCEELGNWDPYQAIQLFQDESSLSIWSNSIQVSSIFPIEYRYMTTTKLQASKRNQNVLKSWENHTVPRKLTEDQASHSVNNKFGFIGDVYSVTSGLATVQKILTLKLKPNAVSIRKDGCYLKQFKIKVSSTDAASANVSNDGENTGEQGSSILIESAVIKESEWQYKTQDFNGCQFNAKEDFVVVQIQAICFDDSVFQINIYNEDDMELGCALILYESISQSHGFVNVPIITSNNRIIGKLSLEYFQTFPVPDAKFSLAKACVFPSSKCLNIGHRGSGTSHGERQIYPPVHENTIASFRLADQKGLDFVEFDVQLSKDLVPVVYHDYHVNLVTNHGDVECNAMDVHIADMTYKQLQSFKFKKNSGPKMDDTDCTVVVIHDLHGDQKLFPSLEYVLKDINPNLGFNIEVKFPNKLVDGSWEVERFWANANHFLDEILKVVFKFAGERKIIFSCFNADICNMLKLKQNVYPVGFLITGTTSRWTPVADTRSICIKNAVYSALNANLQAIVAHSDEIFDNLSLINLVHQFKILLFVWGETTNSMEAVTQLRQHGVDGIIHDWF